MPELPEVETVRLTLKNFVLNQKIENIDMSDVEEMQAKIDDVENEIILLAE